jgi:hypothetical protein
MGAMKNAYRIFFGQPEGKSPRGRPRSRWEDNIRMHLRERGWEDLDWIRLAQYRDQWWAFVNTYQILKFHQRKIIS